MFYTHDDLIYCLTKEYVGSKHGVDFWVGQPVDSTGQIGDAFIAAWNLKDDQGVLIPKPSNDDCADLIAKYADELAKPKIPDRVSSRQFGLQVIADGLKEQVDAWVASQDASTQWAYEHSAMFVRSDPMLQKGFASLGFTKEQIDDFFLNASKRTGEST